MIRSGERFCFSKLRRRLQEQSKHIYEISNSNVIYEYLSNVEPVNILINEDLNLDVKCYHLMNFVRNFASNAFEKQVGQVAKEKK
jgi:hypothetical protein